MDWGIFFTIVGSAATVIGIQYQVLRNIKLDMEGHFEKIDKKFEDQFNKIDSRFERIEKDLQSLNTRIAVIESKLSDISTNVMHLMWHSQAHPHKESAED